MVRSSGYPLAQHVDDSLLARQHPVGLELRIEQPRLVELVAEPHLVREVEQVVLRRELALPAVRDERDAVRLVVAAVGPPARPAVDPVADDLVPVDAPAEDRKAPAL